MFDINLESFLFYFFSFLALTSAIFVVYSKNTVYSVFFLIFVFINITAILLITEIEFLSIMLTIIYVGTITVLFLFIVMMLNIGQESNTKYHYFPVICLLGISFLIEIFLMFSKSFSTYPAYLQKHLYQLKSFHEWYLKSNTITNIETIGQVIYTYYSLFILISGLILLIALIGVVMLTNKEQKYKQFNTKYIYRQLSRNAQYAIFKIK